MKAAAERDVTELHIGAEHTTLSRGSDAGPTETLVLRMGSLKTAAEFFQHVPPTPLEMEGAITAVEDEVMRAARWLKQGSWLRSDDAALREIAHMAGSNGAELSVEAVESLFDLLAALVQGRPAASAGVPTDTAFAATLLILRELMHHLRFPLINIRPISG